MIDPLAKIEVCDDELDHSEDMLRFLLAVLVRLFQCSGIVREYHATAEVEYVIADEAARARGVGATQLYAAGTGSVFKFVPHAVNETVSLFGPSGLPDPE